jgi:prevent-host-death family protein
MEMERTVNATEAKTHFGKLIRRAVEGGETIIVERSGVPQIVIMPISEYGRMKSGGKQIGREVVLQRIRNLKRTIHQRFAEEGRELPDISDLITGLREERDDEITAGLR